MEEEEEFVNPNFIFTQKINQIGKILNEIKETQANLEGKSTPESFKLREILENAKIDQKNWTSSIKILSDENKDRVVFLKKPVIKSDFHPQCDKKSSKLTPSQQFQKLEQVYEDCYFGESIVKEFLQEDEETMPLVKRRSNCGCLLQKSQNSYEYVYADREGSCLSGIQFDISSQQSSTDEPLTIQMKKQIEYAPLKKASKILGLDQIFQGDEKYLRVRSLFGIQHIRLVGNRFKTNSAKSAIFEDENNCGEVFDCAQSNFFSEEQYVLTAGNALFKLLGLEQVSFERKLDNLKSVIESIDCTFHPSTLYLQLTDQISLFDQRSPNVSSVLKVASKKVPLHRIYALKQLEDNYFMVSSTQHFKVYDVRCTNYPVFSVPHGSDESPPTVINIQEENKHELVDSSDEDEEDENEDFSHSNYENKTDKISKEKNRSDQTKIITGYSFHHGGDAVFMSWKSGHTLQHSLYEPQISNLMFSQDDESNQQINTSGSENKLSMSQVIGRESKAERLAFSSSTRNDLQPKTLFSSANISNSLKIRSVNTKIFNNGNNFLALQTDSSGGVTAQIFSKNDGNTFTPIKTEFNPTSDNQQQLLKINQHAKNNTISSSSDPQLESIVALQVSKLFEKREITDRIPVNDQLLTMPIKKKQSLSKTINFSHYFKYLTDNTSSMKQLYQKEIEDHIEKKNKLNQYNTEQHLSSFNSQGIVKKSQSEIHKQLQDMEYPEYKRNTKYNNKFVLTKKNLQNLNSFWDD